MKRPRAQSPTRLIDADSFLIAQSPQSDESKSGRYWESTSDSEEAPLTLQPFKRRKHVHDIFQSEVTLDMLQGKWRHERGKIVEIDGFEVRFEGKKPMIMKDRGKYFRVKKWRLFKTRKNCTWVRKDGKKMRWTRVDDSENRKIDLESVSIPIPIAEEYNPSEESNPNHYVNAKVNELELDVESSQSTEKTEEAAPIPHPPPQRIRRSPPIALQRPRLPLRRSPTFAANMSPYLSMQVAQHQQYLGQLMHPASLIMAQQMQQQAYMQQQALAIRRNQLLALQRKKEKDRKLNQYFQSGSI